MGTLISHVDTNKLDRELLALVPTPDGTDTHRPVPHIQVVSTLIESLSFRHIAVVRDEYAVSKDGQKMFGVLDLEAGFEGVRFSLGIRNAHDKSMRLGLTVGFRVFVCDNMAFFGDFTPVMKKHTKHFNLNDALSIGIDQMQRSFRPMQEQVTQWRETQLSDSEARLVIYRAFIEGELEAPRHLAGDVHDNYFDPQHEEFLPRTRWSLHNAFTTALKLLDPVPQFRATAALAEFWKTN